MTELFKGIDVSHHQLPSSIDWIELAKTHKFCIVRACYGAKTDESAHDHVQRARDVGLAIGLYLFYRPGTSAQAQLDAFSSVADKHSLDIVSALDIEQNEQFDGPMTPQRYAATEAICEAWKQRYGSAMVYTNTSSWKLIGSPEWIRDCHLWIANFDVQTPHTPFDLSWTIWQHRVAIIPGVYSGPLDQNIARSLPLIQKVSPDADTEPAPAPSLIPVEVDWAEVNTDRDDLIKSKN